jgi:hypothetical protein
MRLSSSIIARSAMAISSITLLCALSDPAVSQGATGSATRLPGVTVVSPKQAASSQQVARPSQRAAQAASTVGSHRTSSGIQAPPPATGSTMAKFAALEKTSNNCTDGCQTSFKSGNAPWIGCSASGGVFSPTCRNVRNFKTYAECVENGLLLGYRSGEQWAYCTSLAAGGKFSGEKQVADLKRSGPR